MSFLDNFREPHERPPTESRSVARLSQPARVDPPTHPSGRVAVGPRPSFTHTTGRARGTPGWWILGLVFILSITVLVPWATGKFLLRDTLWRPRSPGVFNLDARESGYFISDWTAGCSTMAVAGLGLALLRALLPGRRLSLVLCLLLAVFAGGTGLASSNTWHQAESTTVGVLAVQPPKVEDACYEATQVLSGITWSLIGNRSCDSATLYEGWRPVLTKKIKRLGGSTDVTILESGSTPKSRGFVVIGQDDFYFFRLDGKFFKSRHRLGDSASYSELIPLSDTFLIVSTSKITAIDRKSGKGLLWSHKILERHSVGVYGKDLYEARRGSNETFSKNAASGWISRLFARSGKAVWRKRCPSGRVLDVELSSGTKSSSPKVDCFNQEKSRTYRVQANGIFKRT